MADTRDRILDSAALLFVERGFRRTSIGEVIDRASLSGKSHFYHYFRSKDQLGLETLSRQCERFAERGAAALRQPTTDPFDRLHRFIDSVVAMQMEGGVRPGTPFGDFAWEMADTHPGIRERLASVFERWASQVHLVLTEASAQLADGADTARLSRFVIVTLEGALPAFRVHRDGEALRMVAAYLKRYAATHRRRAAGES